MVWKKAHALAVDSVKTATRIRQAHLTSLKSQLVRAAISVPTNIVEGTGQESDRDFCRFLRYSVNSANELEYHLILAVDLSIIAEEDFGRLNGQVEEVQKMLHGLLRSLRKPRPRNHPDLA
ncbi:MAG TPA: four helix bundle protein [Gemmatimonadaceae bacterium]|nr:four helix bundle protein [Gemmatimonadaceae bacterium]